MPHKPAKFGIKSWIIFDKDIYMSKYIESKKTCPHIFSMRFFLYINIIFENQ